MDIEREYDELRKIEDERNSRCATNSEALAEYAHNAGMDNPDREWIPTPWDTWERNPFYTGKPGRHPEDDSDCYDDAEQRVVAAYVAEGLGEW